MTIDLTLTVLMTGLIAILSALLGALLFGGAAVAPLAVRVLDEPSAARLLRAYWPRYYRLAVAVGAALTGVLMLLAVDVELPTATGSLLASLAAFMTFCFAVALVLIPRINAARDHNQPARFRRLHGIDMGLTGLGLLSGLVLLAVLIGVLPGQILIIAPGPMA